jgi:hypothetical protein
MFLEINYKLRIQALSSFGALSGGMLAASAGLSSLCIIVVSPDKEDGAMMSGGERPSACCCYWSYSIIFWLRADFSFYSTSAGFGFLGGLPRLFLSSTIGKIMPVIWPPWLAPIIFR